MKYFAYGSNLLEERLLERTPGAKLFAVGHVPSRKLVWYKKGKDGSGKCHISESSPDSQVHGVVFDIPDNQIGLLDNAEGCGYSRTTIEVLCDDLPPISAMVYIARPEHLHLGLCPFSWYRELVIAGAIQHNLPAQYVTQLRSAQAIIDHDREREQAALKILERSQQPFKRSGRRFRGF